ncbi:hypothetical protein STIB_47340 [Streptomyces sp. IB2014 011-1]|nr:hypothetical protein STIB_47340 [Streptomyces sp. IB2014 011-1]
MSRAGTRVGVGTRFRYDGENVEVVEMATTTAGNEVVLKDAYGRLLRLSLKELLFSDRAAICPDGPGPSGGDEGEIASVVLGQLDEAEKRKVLDRAEHVREVLTGYRSGSPELARDGEPRPEYAPEKPLEVRYAAKITELGTGLRTLKRWVAAFREHGEAGLARRKGPARKSELATDDRWVETALEVMVEHTGESKPSRTMVIERTRSRVIARFGPEVVPQPSRATAFRLLEELERRHPLFRLSTKRNRDIADRPEGVYGKLRPTRPGEYLLMDSTRLDVFAFDPFTLRWVQAELSVGMDWSPAALPGFGSRRSRRRQWTSARCSTSRSVLGGRAPTGRGMQSGPSTAFPGQCWSTSNPWRDPAWCLRRWYRRRWWSITARSMSRSI